MAGCAKEKSVSALWIHTCYRAWEDTQSLGRAGFTTQTWHEERWEASKDGSRDVTLQVRQFARFAASKLQQQLKTHACYAGSAAKSFQYISWRDAKLKSALGGFHRQLDSKNNPATVQLTFRMSTENCARTYLGISLIVQNVYSKNFVGYSFRTCAICSDPTHQILNAAFLENSETCDAPQHQCKASADCLSCLQT